MITPTEARLHLYRNHYQPHDETVRLEVASGRVTADDTFSDRPFPPFHRVAMDGIAVSAESFQQGVRSWKRERRQFAGEPKVTREGGGDTCIETSTGAVLPGNCNAIIPYEWLDEDEHNFTLNTEKDIVSGMNIHRMGTDLDADVCILPLGSLISAPEIAALASVGAGVVRVRSLPRTAIVSTGDELVNTYVVPQEHQIRQSNAFTIASILAPTGVKADHYHLPDDYRSMSNWFEKYGTGYDLVIFSGGVSMGKRDFIPGILNANGIETLFHRVAQRPGKPLYFGTNGDTFVFGLPGNPVSTLTSALVYVRTWIEISLGLRSDPDDRRRSFVKLGKDITFKPNLTLFHPVTVKNEGTQRMAYPKKTNGSGDFISLIGATGVIELPAAQEHYEVGSYAEYFPFVWQTN